MDQPTIDERSLITTHLLEVLLLAVRKLPDSSKVHPPNLIMGVAELLGDLLRAVPQADQDELLPEVLKAVVEQATQQRTSVRAIVVMPPSETQH